MRISLKSTGRVAGASPFALPLTAFLRRPRPAAAATRSFAWS
jgi:hypothetical protein